MSNNHFILDEEDIEHIILYPNDNGYDEFKNFKNAEIINEDTDDEHIVFYTHNKAKLTTLDAYENQNDGNEIKNTRKQR